MNDSNFFEEKNIGEWENDSSDPSISRALSVIPDSSLTFLYNQTKMLMGKMVDYKELRMIYACAMKVVKTKFEVLNTEFNLQYHRNPINSVQTRLKSTSSIVSKLVKMNKPLTIDSIEENINDIAGVRVICSYIDDIYLIADALLKQHDVTLITKKDYISNPKPNGYRSLHLIIRVPVFLADKSVEMKVEVQIRTIAMDFWASLEHQLHYKQNYGQMDELVGEMKECAETINATDKRMLDIRMKMEALADKPTEEDILFEKFSKFDMPIE